MNSIIFIVTVTAMKVFTLLVCHIIVRQNRRKKEAKIDQIMKFMRGQEDE